MRNQHDTKGFTIVELLIVIVVIAILATVTVVAFNGVQQRARNTNRIATAKNFVSMINQYVVMNGRMPGNAAFAGEPCLGRDVNNRCKGVDPVDVTNGNHSTPDPQLDSDLRTISNIPVVTSQPIKTTNSYYIKAYVGPILSGDTSRYVDGKQVSVAVTYWLEGEDRNCGLPVFKYVDYSNSRNNYTMNNPEGYTQTGWSFTSCVTAVQVPGQ